MTGKLSVNIGENERNIIIMKLKGRKFAIAAAVAGTLSLIGASPVIADSLGAVGSQIQVADAVVDIDTTYSESKVAADVTGAEAADSFADKAVAIADLDVKESTAEDSAVAGKLAAKNIAFVRGSENDWTLIESGELKGYVKTADLCFGDEAEAVALLNGNVKAKVKADETRGYTDGSASEVSATHAAGAELSVVGSDEEHVIVEDDNKVKSFVKHQDVDVDAGLAFGKTTAQIEEEERKKAEEEARKKAEEEAKKKAEEEAAAKAAEEEAAKAAESQVSYGVDTTGWSTGVASAYGGATDPGCGTITANGSYVSESSMGVAIPLAWGRRDLLGHTVLISYGGQTVTAVINDLGGMGGGSRSLDLQPGVFRAFGFSSCNGWGLRTVQYKIL